MSSRDEIWWQVELAYLRATTRTRGLVPEMNKDTEVFKRYCAMQMTLAVRDGRNDVATEIQGLIDKLQKSA